MKQVKGVSEMRIIDDWDEELKGAFFKEKGLHVDDEDVWFEDLFPEKAS